MAKDIENIWIVVLSIFCVIIGFVVGYHAIPKGYSSTDFDYFKAGYNDRYINIARGMIMNCTPYKVSVNQWYDLNGNIKGIIYWCQKPQVNITLPIVYSNLFYQGGAKLQSKNQ